MQKRDSLASFIGFIGESPGSLATTRIGVFRQTFSGWLLAARKRPTIAVIPMDRNLGEGELLLMGNSSPTELLRHSLLQRRSAIVVKGAMSGIWDVFGIDAAREVQAKITSTGLIIAFGRKGGSNVVVHVAINDTVKPALERLASGASIGREALPEFVPWALEWDGRRLVSARLPGESIQPWGRPEGEVQARISAALSPLAALHARGRTDVAPEEEFEGRIAAYVARHPRRAELQPALGLYRKERDANAPAVTVHGDYWLNNVLFDGPAVSGIVDWDRARRNGSACLDALYLGFMTYAMWAETYVSDLLADLWTGQWQYPWLNGYCNLICREFSTTKKGLRSIAALLWLSCFYYNEAPTARWEERMIRPMHKALMDDKRSAVGI